MPPGVEIFAGRDVLITGGLGFIGSALARRLVGLSARVTLVDSLIPEYGGNAFNVHDIRDRVTINVADVRDPHAMAWLVQGRDFLFNLAGQTSHLDSMVGPAHRSEHQHGGAAVHPRSVPPPQSAASRSCSRARGRSTAGRSYLPVDEKHPLQPVDVNGINKLAGESYHLLYNDVYGIRASVLRLTNTYGPGMRVKDARQTFLGIWIRQLLEGTPIQVFGTGGQRRDFNFIDDVVDALLRAAADPASEGQIFNLGHSEHVTLLELAATAGRVASGRALRDRAVSGRSRGDRHRRLLQRLQQDRERARLGSERAPCARAWRRTVEYYDRHRRHYWNANA